MATRISNPAIQHFDKATGAQLAGGQLFFYETGTTTLKSIYDDAGEVTEIANPAILDGNGFEPDIFGSGLYRIVLLNSDGVQQWERDPVDFDVSGVAFSPWLPTVTYGLNDIVEGSDGNFYISIIPNNFNNDPTVIPTAWSQFDLLNRWNVNETYSIEDVVRSPTSGAIYTSLTDSNLGNDPDADTNRTNWQMVDNIRLDGSTISAVPAGTGLIISDADAGNIQISSGTGDIDISTANPGNISLSTGNDITIQATSAFSDIDIISTGNIGLQAGAGEIDINGVSTDVRLRTTISGSVFVEPVGSAVIDATNRIDLEADNNINITAGADIPIIVTGAITVNGTPISLAGVTQQVFTTPGAGTWNKPDTIVNYILVEVQGAGAGGGANNTATGSAFQSGQGGGGGGYTRQIYDVTAISSINFTVGTAGTGGVASSGTDGTDSVFSGTPVITGGGGVGGLVGSPTNDANGYTANGGTASGGQVNINGSSGSHPLNFTNGTMAGRGGGCYFGEGPTFWDISTNTAGLDADIPGTGGMGGLGPLDSSIVAGGDGADGIIIVTEFR